MSYQVPEEVSSAEAREHFTDIVDEAAYRNKRVVLKRNKKKMCAIVSIEDLNLLEKLDNEHDLKEALEAIESNKGEAVISHKEMKEHLGL
jgi:PHD/YefM family antitoxin component YafN of YafNO toxin-antitoxin module